MVCLAVGAPLHGQSWTTFYSAYEDGQKALGQGDPALAMKAYRRAIALAPEPGARVKTYGLNFLSAYHPYLRLAEAALAAGDLGQAQAALAESAARGAEPQDQREALLARLRRAQKAAAPAPATPAPAPAPAQTPQPAPVAAAAQSEPQPKQTPAVTPAPGLRAEPRPEPAKALDRPAAPSPTTPAPVSGPVPAPVSGPVPAPALTSPQSPAPGWQPAAARPVPVWASWLGGLALLLGGSTWLISRRRRQPPPGTQIPTTSPFPYSHATLETPAAGLRITDSNLERHFGPWVAKRVLGTGGCGTAYFGVHQDTGAEVAIKVPHRHLLQNPEFLARFRREAAMGALLDHPGIVRILDPGPAEGEPWLIMPFINGVTLENYLLRFSPLPVPWAIRLASDVAEAIAYAHTKGVVHRDLKPANIMVGDQGAVVMDLGIARITDSGKHTSVYLGTPTYSAPEAMQNPSVGPPADRYALGIILFEMLAGAPPFQSENAFKLLEAHCFEPLPDLLAARPLVPQRLHRLIQRLCEKKAEDRPEDGETIQILRELKLEFPCEPS
jgi:hypothetical protein